MHRNLAGNALLLGALLAVAAQAAGVGSGGSGDPPDRIAVQIALAGTAAARGGAAYALEINGLADMELEADDGLFEGLEADRAPLRTRILDAAGMAVFDADVPFDVELEAKDGGWAWKLQAKPGGHRLYLHLRGAASLAADGTFDLDGAGRGAARLDGEPRRVTFQAAVAGNATHDPLGLLPGSVELAVAVAAQGQDRHGAAVSLLVEGLARADVEAEDGVVEEYEAKGATLRVRILDADGAVLAEVDARFRLELEVDDDEVAWTLVAQGRAGPLHRLALEGTASMDPDGGWALLGEGKAVAKLAGEPRARQWTLEASGSLA